MNTIVQIDGAVIRKLREEQGLTQLYIATAVGVTVDTISRWENKRYPGIKQDNGLKLSLALGVELEDISRQSDNAAVEETERIHPGTVPEATSEGWNWKWLLLGCIVLFGIGGGFLWRSTRPHITLTALRVLPPHSAPGHPFPVAVMISGNPDLNTPLLIREHLGGSCQARDARDPDKYLGQSPKWIGRMHDGTAVFMYMVYPDKSISLGDILSFTGEVVVSDQQYTLSIKGQDTIRIMPYHWADTNRDNSVSDTEILKVYERWAFDSSVFNLGPVEDLWQGGHYSWNASTPEKWERGQEPTKAGE